MPSSASETQTLAPGEPLLADIDAAALLGLGKATSRSAGEWTPPTTGELAGLIPGYDILGFIGRGGMGAVYRVRHRTLERDAAVKILPPALAADPDFAARFHREARALARLQHPGIVTVHDCGTTTNGLLYLVMEYIDGVELSRLTQSGRLEPVRALRIVASVCEALAYAHEQGVIHRDIKPGNVLIDTMGRVKLADFGLAKIARTSGGDDPTLSALHTRKGTLLGTPLYAAPEQMRPGAVGIDHRADIYSLGVMLYELLTGDVPRGVFAPPSAKTDADARVDGIVARAMQERPEARYQRAGEMAREITTIVESTKPSVSPTPPIGDPQKQASRPDRGRGARPVLRTATLLLVCVAGWLLYMNGKPRFTQLSERGKVSTAVAPVSATLNGVAYRLQAPMPWGKAQESARASGGSLASVPDASTAQFLVATFGQSGPEGFLTGGQCWSPGGSWEWADGSPFSYSGWAGAAPVYGALVLMPDGSWKAESFDRPLPSVIRMAP